MNLARLPYLLLNTHDMRIRRTGGRYMYNPSISLEVLLIFTTFCDYAGYHPTRKMRNIASKVGFRSAR